MTAMDTNTLMTMEAAAVRLDCSLSTIRRRVRDGSLTLHRAWGRKLVSRHEVERMAREHSQQDQATTTGASDEGGGQ